MSSNEGGQDRASKAPEEQAEAVDAAVPDTSGTTERVSALTDDVDALLDEIDDVLEENAEEFVKGYVQKGGQ